MKKIVIDNPVAKNLLRHPNPIEFFNLIFPENIDIETLASFCLFHEYLGLQKKLCPNIQLNFNKIIKTENDHLKYNSECGKFIDDIFNEITSDIYAKLINLHAQIHKQLIDERLHNPNKEIENFLFKNIIHLLENNYETFASLSSFHLSWNYFNNISIPNYNIQILRQQQLHIWWQLYNQNIILPFGRIIDDLEEHNNAAYDGVIGDLVDEEGIINIILNATDFITYDKPDVCLQRFNASENILKMIEQTENIKIPRSYGTIICLENDKTNAINNLPKIIQTIDLK